MRLRFAVPLAVLAVTFLPACTSGESSSSPSSATATAASAANAAPPTYQLSEDRGVLTALVRTDDTAELRSVFDEIADDVLANRPDGGYHVRLDCAIGHDPTKAANRLANGRIAVGALGAAQTGLKPGQRTIEFNTGRTCREGAPTTTFDPGRQLDREYALQLCRGRLEEKYVADQRPLDFTGVSAVEGAEGWTVTGAAQGKAKPGATTAVVDFECRVRDNPPRTEVVRFEPR
ncbi:hypothetical protein [Nocardia farcinica]|uniref:hypothetical protein n=1 Tax=Nocardia farcinica TaxID=37329 RepID=UPI0018959D8E|nr:hypothetical protein [Nocardia farcinica]MBF6189406.1 hypothetical protein [Nocardia farcinica]MBF6291784.1 hypothetical protein [Nocardia farcinica]